MERQKKLKTAAMLAALLHYEADVQAAQAALAAAAPAPAPTAPAVAAPEASPLTPAPPCSAPAPAGPSLWSLAGRRDHMDLRCLWQLRLGRSC